ncbi:MAG: DNA recombination protein RmuC [Pseudorhodoplanes sp.]
MDFPIPKMDFSIPNTDTLILIAGATLIVVAGLGMLLALIALLFPKLRRRTDPDPTEVKLMELARLQTEAGGRVQAMTEMLASRQAELARLVNERLDNVTRNLGQSMQVNAKQTTDNLQALQARLAVIDNAQKNITELASQVTSLREVLSNPQSRGAFGQGRMEALVADGLPKGSYEFQFTLTNGKRPDCVVFLPDQRPLIIDAKFPLEATSALRDARSDEDRKIAAQRVRQDVGKHIGDIASRYLIPGETHELALMFIPSESVYADLHDGFEDLIQKAYRAQVMLVSPTLLMLAVQVIRQIQKDIRMREAADRVRTEVGHMMKDVGLLTDRVRKLQQHFGQTTDDMNMILTSAGKITKRASRIEELDFDGDVPDNSEATAGPIRLKLGANAS